MLTLRNKRAKFKLGTKSKLRRIPLYIYRVALWRSCRWYISEQLTDGSAARSCISKNQRFSGGNTLSEASEQQRVWARKISSRWSCFKEKNLQEAFKVHAAGLMRSAESLPDRRGSRRILKSLMSLRLLVSPKPSWIKRIILGFPLKSFPWCSWSQQQIDFWMRGRWSSLCYCSVWSWCSKTSPQTLHLLPPLLASSGAFLTFFFCYSISSSCFLHPPTANNLFGLLTNHFVKELMNFVSFFPPIQQLFGAISSTAEIFSFYCPPRSLS